MKTRIILLTLTGLLLCMPACGREEETKSAGNSIGIEAVNFGDGSREDSSADKEENSSIESGSDKEDQPVGQVKIPREHFTGEEDTTRNGQHVQYTYEYDELTVEIPWNTEAQEKVQAALEEATDSFLASLQADDFGVVWEGYSGSTYQTLSADTVRADEKVISILFTNEGYNGGAHGWCNTYYLNFFTETGDIITFDELGEGFREKAEELVLKKAQEMQAEEPWFFEDYEKYIPFVVKDGTENAKELYAKVYGDDNYAGDDRLPASFYITETGFGFVSGQYVMQPYAAGIIEFEIPAEDFEGVCRKDIF